MSRHGSDHSEYPPMESYSAVADCAPVPQTRGAISMKQIQMPTKHQQDNIDSGFVSSGLLSPCEALSPPDTQAKLLYPKEASDRPKAVDDLTTQISELHVEGLGGMSDEERAALEERYIQILEEAFRGDEDGDTHLHLAIIYGYPTIAQCLIRLVPHPEFLNLRNSYLQTPLHLAALTGQWELCRHLLVAGADVTLRDRHGNTPLHLACERADRASVRALTAAVSAHESHQLAPKYACPPVAPPPVDDWNYQGLSCLHLATLSGDVELVTYLVSYGASVSVGEGKSGRTPVHLAADAGNVPLLCFLVQACCAPVDAVTYGGLTGYQLALLNARLDVAETLERLGAGRKDLPDSDSDMSSDSDDSEMFLRTADLVSDIRIRGWPLVTKP